MGSKFTVIVPSYKGGEYLKQCVSSVLAQTYPAFELAVLDNYSEDGTAEWLASLGDPRIKVYTSSTALTIEQNWARALEIPKNEFITFFGHDDLMDANYLEVMDALIQKYPDAALYHAHFRFIDEAGGVIKSCRPLPPHETDAEFLKAFLTWQIDANGTGYVMRSKAYDAVGGIPHFKNLLYADHALWLMLTRNSYKVTAPEECFSYRLHATSTSSSSAWQTHLTAITQFMDFFLNFNGWSREAKQVFEKHGTDFFSTLCGDWYMVLLVQATKRNQRLDSRVLYKYSEVLARIAPEKAEELRHSRTTRVRQFINSNPLTRLMYIGYIMARYGRNHLLPTRGQTQVA